ncbi:MAG TPA: FAD-dependent oxidoreductase [Chitinophagaceae bacterium]
MQIEYLIIGQGISGTWLSYFLQKACKSFVVIDNNTASAASKVAAGIINPVTGRRMVKAWMIDDLLPFIKQAYERLGQELSITSISQKNIIDFFPTPQMMLAFQQRQLEDDLYLKNPEANNFASFFNYDFGCGEIDPVYMVHLDAILPAWKKRLIENNQYYEEEFQANQLQVFEKIVYKEITAEKIIFCDGINSFQNNSWFNKLPFAPNKGEVLIIEAAELPANNIFKKGIMLAPLTKKSLYWVGSNYLWDFENDQPTESFYFKTKSLLQEWLKSPFKIVDHLAAIRPATLERRPFVGFHPLQKNLGILNGMGTKGCSLAPFFAKQMADHLIKQTPLNPEADINRFQRILTK